MSLNFQTSAADILFLRNIDDKMYKNTLQNF